MQVGCACVLGASVSIFLQTVLITPLIAQGGACLQTFVAERRRGVASSDAEEGAAAAQPQQHQQQQHQQQHLGADTVAAPAAVGGLSPGRQRAQRLGAAQGWRDSGGEPAQASWAPPPAQVQAPSLAWLDGVMETGLSESRLGPMHVVAVGPARW